MNLLKEVVLFMLLWVGPPVMHHAVAHSIHRLVNTQAAYDVIVIGGGSAGSGFAKRAAGYGAKVVLIDRGVARDGTGKRQGAGIGGTCVNVSAHCAALYSVSQSYVTRMLQHPCTAINRIGNYLALSLDVNFITSAPFVLIGFRWTINHSPHALLPRALQRAGWMCA